MLGGGDVRLAIRTDDHAVVLMRYFGRLRFVPGKESASRAGTLTAGRHFGCGALSSMERVFQFLGRTGAGAGPVGLIT